MRVPRFRAKAIIDCGISKAGEWVYTNEFLGGGFIGLWAFFQHVERLDYDPTTLGQYTGVKDKNGVDIYEGDIITGRNSDGFNDKTFPPTSVIFKEGMFCCEYWNWIVNDESEIIGNIHEKDRLNDRRD
jgi:hypothetical protein